MALSKTYTAEIFYSEAVRDSQISNDFSFEKFDLINRSVDTIATSFSSLLVNDYRDRKEVSIDDNTIDLSSFRIVRVDGTSDVVVEIEGASNNRVNFINPKLFLDFNPNYSGSRNEVIGIHSGEFILLRYGSNISMPQLGYIWYHGYPNKVKKNADYIDLSDGPLMELALIKLNRMILVRDGQIPKNRSDEIGGFVQNVYDNHKVYLSSQTKRDKIEEIA